MNVDLLPNIAKELAQLLKEKNAAYGNSFEESEKIIKILYPKGVDKNKYKDFLTLIRIIDKLFRIATDPNAFNEEPFKDIAGYSLLALASKRSQNEIDGEGF